MVRNTDATEKWNVGYYEHLANFYSLFFEDLERNMEEEGQWLDGVLRVYGVRSVLDASCGTGRQAIPLRSRGYRVVAADPSESMLEEARRMTRRKGVSIPLVRSTFSELPQLGQEFDAVIALGNGLAHLDGPEAISVALRALRACCRSICLIGIKDFETIKLANKRFHGHKIVDSNGVRSILFEIWDIDDCWLTSSTFILQGREADWSVTSDQTHEYMLTESELERLSNRAGFSIIHRLPHPREAVFALEP